MNFRGNAKVLKSQDGNYIRAVRQSGLKVSFCDGPISPNETNYLIWRIDKLKAELNVLPRVKEKDGNLRSVRSTSSSCRTTRKVNLPIILLRLLDFHVN